MEPIDRNKQHTPPIAILMATYNGGQYLREQIDSILKQSSHDWRLYIHDDGSKDDTPTILTDYATRFPQQVSVLDYPSQGGALPNFMSLLERVEADYYMFSDQDDVWHPTKVEESYIAMQEQERLHPGKPIIVHCDVRVVDSNLKLIHPSYREYGHIYPEKVISFQRCVINITLGCAMLFNARSRAVSLDRPWKAALMHDGWVTTRTFAEHGIVYAMPAALMEYRNHGGNTVGATDGSRFTIGYRLSHFGQMLRLNLRQYRMLRSAGYGSIFTYYYNKFLLHIH
ncbi:MAG: glycosyltransferase [Prevotella sp.]|nr:glycosyltransferase [Prevotella sp.]